METRTYGPDYERTLDELIELYGSASDEEVGEALRDAFPEMVARIRNLEACIIEMRVAVVNWTDNKYKERALKTLLFVEKHFSVEEGLHNITSGTQYELDLKK